MGRRQFDEAARLVIQSPGFGRFGGGMPDATVQRAQELLGIAFPQSYVSFLCTFGCGQIPLHEFYGLVDEAGLAEGAPNVVWLTLNDRRHGLPASYVEIESTGFGPVYCLDTSLMNEQGECPVVLYAWGSTAEPERIAPSFGAYFLKCVHEALLESKAGQ